jgi:hypothetical protein
LQAVLPIWQRHLSLVRQQTHEGADALVRSLGDLAMRLDATDLQDPSAQALRSGIDAMAMSLQFEDRVCQILSVVGNDIQRLHSALANNQPLPSQADWLNALQAYYTMHEQNLAAPAADAPLAEAATPARHDVFF